MAHKCKATNSRPWQSKIKGNPEGDITVGTEGPDGRFRGRHKGKNKDTAGLCFEAGGGQPDKILFVVPANNPEFLYMGVIDENGEHIAGQRHSFIAFIEAQKQDTKAAPLGDEWTAEKPPTEREDDDRSELG